MKKWVTLGFSGLVLTLALLGGYGFAEETLSVGKPLSGSVARDVYELTNDLSAAEAAVSANPDDAEAHFLLAVAYSRTPYFEKALAELRKARKLAKKSPEGFALFDRKIGEYERLLEKSPDDPLVLYRLGFGYYMRGYGVQHGYLKDEPAAAERFYDKAEQTMRRLVSASPEDVWAKNYLGFFLVEQDEKAHLAEAVRLWEESLRINPNDPGAKILLGEAYLKQGNLRKAVEYAGQALQARQQWLNANRTE